MWTTTLEPDELLADARFPVWGERAGFATEEFARRHGDFAIAGAAVGIQLDDAGAVTRSAIALFGLGATPLRASAAEAALAGAAARVRSTPSRSAGSPSPTSTRRPATSTAVPTYRRRIGAVMVERAVQRAVERAGAMSHA